MSKPRPGKPRPYDQGYGLTRPLRKSTGPKAGKSWEKGVRDWLVRDFKELEMKPSDSAILGERGSLPPDEGDERGSL